jgi:hypothetical protein
MRCSVDFGVRVIVAGESPGSDVSFGDGVLREASAGDADL